MARCVLRAFGTAERRAFYACRSSFAKIFSNENILARLRFICTSARRILRAFGTVDRRAFYACRSFFAKIFSRENILAISYNVVAKGFTCYAFCAPICCSRSLWRKSECGDAMIVSSLSPQRENETEQRLRVPRRCCLFLTEFCRAFARENS